ncbi:NAD-dependent epimerase/dehydratase family protein [Agromyces seonyuensis]|uniref:NAD-dependent epimerase/dehydratase family protein n=1 Tax=Agromyces seonyuensis TaxID=2662446 RepID=A0A6I4NXN1_9MICO|nr:NAD-dependent epimerase/dehydratase family protein [Agromyces seonyuensis]MWB97275.1 NAD-dependent epimerase/dehydratase family protein [Agromyces seonyuensis]
MSRRALITGGAGFIGSRLAARFARSGWDVDVLDPLSEQVHGVDPVRTSASLRGLEDSARLTIGSVSDPDALEAALGDAEVVVHLAAETGTGQSMYEIGRYADVNVGGTATLLDRLVRGGHSVRRVVVASSRAVYGEGAYADADGRIVYPAGRDDARLRAGEFDPAGADGRPLRPAPTPEDAPLAPTSVYGITKLTQESLVRAVSPAVGIEPVTLRYQNVYGPGQSLRNPYTGILSIFTGLIARGEPINVFEDGLPSRDFVYVDDVVEATFLAATEPAAAGGVFNVGTGVGTSVLDVVRALFTAAGAEVPAIVSGDYRLGDIRHNIADTTRLRETLGFVPATDFATGLAAFAAWADGRDVGADGYRQSLEELESRNLLRRG